MIATDGTKMSQSEHLRLGVISAVLVLFCTLQCSTVEARNKFLDVGPRIINGTEASANNTRHQVSIRLKILDMFFGAGHQCGGSVIAPTVIMTAAHCFYDGRTGKFRPAKEYKVVMGSVDRYDRQNSVVFEVTHFTIMESFNISTYQDDIALVFLDGTIPKDLSTVESIAYDKDPVPPGTVCTVTGWGITEVGVLARHLMTLNVSIIDRETCSTNYEDFVIDGMVCAGYMEGEKDACNGDSGGPLVCDGKLAGIVSWGIGCARAGYPGVYTEVSYYSEWIRKEARGNGNERLTVSIGLLVGIVSLLVFNNKI